MTLFHSKAFIGTIAKHVCIHTYTCILILQLFEVVLSFLHNKFQPKD